MNRAERRRKVKNRLFTKKGFTRVVHVGPGGQATNIPTKKGSRIDNMAHHNAKKLRKKREPDA